MENFPYTLLKDSHPLKTGMRFFETDAEVWIGTARRPVLPLLAIVAGAFAIPWLVGSIPWGAAGTVWKYLLHGGLTALFVWSAVRWERTRWAVFVLDKATGRYFFPRERREVHRSELVEVALVEAGGGYPEADGDRPTELQMLVKRRGNLPEAIPLLGCRGAGVPAGLQFRLATALDLPAVWVRASA